MTDRDSWVLWGWMPATTKDPGVLAGGTMRYCQERMKISRGGGWKCAIYPQGEDPGAFREMIAKWKGSG